MASPFQVGLAMQVCYNYLARHRLTDTFRPFLSLTRPFYLPLQGLPSIKLGLLPSVSSIFSTTWANIGHSTQRQKGGQVSTRTIFSESAPLLRGKNESSKVWTRILCDEKFGVLVLMVVDQ